MTDYLPGGRIQGADDRQPPCPDGSHIFDDVEHILRPGPSWRRDYSDVIVGMSHFRWCIRCLRMFSAGLCHCTAAERDELVRAAFRQ
jgi:hypothetical protein